VTSANPHRLPRSVVPSAYRIFLVPDLDAATFTGRIEIDVDVTESTSTLTLNSIELELGRASVSTAGRIIRSAPPSLDSTYETATFEFDEAIDTGHATIEIAYSGVLNDQLHGFYRSTFIDDSGTSHTIATTQFEASDARRAFPCWDEPSFKATFQVNLTIPDDLEAYSNSSAVSDTNLGNGQRVISFATTMKMSTYVVAFVVGPFDATEPIDVDGVPVRVIFPRGKRHLTSFALEVAAHALRFFSDYFALSYPGDKFDMIAVPDFAAGAMENLGLVTFRETLLLTDTERASLTELKHVALVINHETAHMWFGDLVTMEWWEGIWLNEAFATFMEGLCTDNFRPEWRQWVGFNASKDNAFAVDSLHSTRPIEYEVVSPNDFRGMFDVLTYIKGCSVLRMLEQYLGPEIFRDGIRRYLVTHAYANTVTNDLWRSLEQASGEPVAEIMDTWILQGGFPLVCLEDGQLEQQPFSYGATASHSNIGERWMVPVLSRSIDASEVHRQLLTGSREAVGTSGVAVVNAGGTGFYRVAYGANELAAISRRLLDLSEGERAALFSDTWESVLVGRSTYGDLLGLAARIGELDEAAPWVPVNQALRAANRLVDDEGRESLAAVTRRLVGPQLERLGWQRSKGEREGATELRPVVIDMLGTLGEDRGVINEALRRFDDGRVAGDLGHAILSITVQQDREGDVELIESRRLVAPNPQEAEMYLFAPTSTPSLAVATALFERCFDDVRTQDAPYLVGALVRNRHVGPEIWRLLTKHWDEALDRFAVGRAAFAVVGVSSMIADPALAREIREFHETHPVPGGQRQVEQALERMDNGVAFAQRVRNTLVAQLESVR